MARAKVEFPVSRRTFQSFVAVTAPIRVKKEVVNKFALILDITSHVDNLKRKVKFMLLNRSETSTRSRENGHFSSEIKNMHTLNSDIFMAHGSVLHTEFN